MHAYVGQRSPGSYIASLWSQFSTSVAAKANTAAPFLHNGPGFCRLRLARASTFHLFDFAQVGRSFLFSSSGFSRVIIDNFVVHEKRPRHMSNTRNIVHLCAATISGQEKNSERRLRNLSSGMSSELDYDSNVRDSAATRISRHSSSRPAP